jgi:hypothetical protein
MRFAIKANSIAYPPALERIAGFFGAGILISDNDQ